MEDSINSAIRRGFLQQVRFLIELGHSVNKRDENTRTPLINCALIEDENWGAGLARLLIEKGAHISFRDKRGLNALHYACVFGRPRIVEVYLNALDFELTLTDKFGNTALHYAANVGCMETCKMLIRAHKRYQLDADLPNRRQETPLIMAWKAGYLQCGMLFVTECNSNTDQCDVDGFSANQWYEISIRKDNDLATIRRQRECNKRPRTASARLERLATPKRTHRPDSANLPLRHNQTYIFRQKESLNTDPVRIVRNAQVNLYRPASYSDLRNKPEYVFQLSPADCFVNQARYPMSPMSRSMSRSHSAIHLSNSSNSDSMNSSWRESIKSFFTSYDYQFSHSFCRGAIPPPEVDVESLTNTDDRVESPTPTHASEPGDSDVGSMASLARKIPKKIGAALSGLKAFSEITDKGDKRRISRQEKSHGPPSRKTSSLKPPTRSG